VFGFFSMMWSARWYLGFHEVFLSLLVDGFGFGDHRDFSVFIEGSHFTRAYYSDGSHHVRVRVVSSSEVLSEDDVSFLYFGDTIGMRYVDYLSFYLSLASYGPSLQYGYRHGAVPSGVGDRGVYFRLDRVDPGHPFPRGVPIE